MQDMLDFEIDATSARRVQEALNGLGEALGPAGRAMILKKIAEIYLEETEKRFVSQSDPDRKRWPKLKESTIRIKKKKGSFLEPEHIGILTTDLFNSIKYRISGDQVYVGSNLRYAPWFHYGSKTGGWGPRPSRRFLGRNTRIDAKVLKLYEKEIERLVGIKMSNVGLLEV